MSRDPIRSDEQPESNAHYAYCKECEWNSEPTFNRDEVPNECQECGGEVEVDYV